MGAAGHKFIRIFYSLCKSSAEMRENMSQNNVTNAPFEDLYFIEPPVYGDER